jgi:hypothetical protein
MESSSEVLLCVLVTGELQREIEITISASSLSADPSQDFTFPDDVIMFTPTVLQECFNFSVVDEGIVEADELVMIVLGQNSVASIPTPGVIVTIQDSSTVNFSFQMELYNITESQTTDVCVELEGVTVRNIIITLSTATG